MVKLNDLETFLQIYHVKQVSKEKWKLGPFEITFFKGMIVISGKFLYPLAKEICSKPSYGKDLFLSKQKENLPFECFLTNTFVEDSLSFLSSDCNLIGTYEEYSQKYNSYKLKFISSYIADGNSDKLFLEEIVVTQFSPLREVLLSITNFYLESPCSTSIST